MPIIRLLDSEVKISRHEGVIATITIFKGLAPIDKLQKRMQAILDANPWVGARLISDRSDELAFTVPEVIDSTVPYFEVFDITKIMGSGCRIENLREMIHHDPDEDIVNKLYISSVDECIDQDKQLVKFSLIEDVNNNEFAIIFSMNHLVGDGTSYYQLLNMLSFDEE
ncbi:hypothetical protein C1141_19265, partial [Vibrio agarivorans]